MNKTFTPQNSADNIVSTTLSEKSFNQFIQHQGKTLTTPQHLSPFINVDRQKYFEWEQKNSFNKSFLDDFKKRMDSATYAKMRGGISHTLLTAQRSFPAYKFLVKEFINDEWTSAVSPHKAFHRDHIVHQPMTAYVAMVLLGGVREDHGSNKNFNLNLLSKAATQLKEATDCQYLRDYMKELRFPKQIYQGNFPQSLYEQCVKESTYLASLFHDIGYPYQFVGKIQNNLRDHSQVLVSLDSLAGSIGKAYKNRLVFHPLDGYRTHSRSAPSTWKDKYFEIIKEGLRSTHGMHSALNFLFLNDRIRKFPDDPDQSPLSRFCLEWAAKAILMHDMCGLYIGRDKKGKIEIKHKHLRIRFRTSPLSYILALADCIQNFGRVNAKFSKIKRMSEQDKTKEEILQIQYGSKCSKVELEFDTKSKELTIVSYYPNIGDVIENNTKYMPEQERLFFNPDFGYLDSEGTGISRILLRAKHDPDHTPASP
ncbi:hypothetical protein SAMN05660337_0477 [Maridesulfovibrio ferrireducens]|uniref:HD domain-containing protein n=1 Tax=Maridesulfovibrio ferrireducens TaxID=246191 RepID=A0A1G9BZ89_9BACT|nr:hypothetical protein [Maridesulfovibrio ferrireducens]SDK44750.1 hypothetical protein SAMN05660337_0477 [Maridesulfovibrio ferrireducens]